ncbi:N-alpha-acetyltransferase 20, NatB catalytic subunit [Thecamonas trahens ATCC 50062]|uniref:N-alpha-acetyltransferase 20, NatB catalytic subunit n=1 Tax=Thecamonas trahens ATCC 50062 TaxID=461836 RepID=A0A0L0D6R1_THETB|nr:N-alpha-acetyltransferase 20, NatB catalytic subunit [Thecamonas trahens ATCC 50062]KNC47890.1 N-alpha-acetyltransferase 20, NatB catalytic subunit [Thecamonas trahens ATCC 50062]|eukprot:XP_013758912.1 N-alpha-acetyltransferase 20, NatB catalytic subunit [Thecamonas trahens ATCC 50062]
MTSIRRFVADDLFKFNNINLDSLTENYNIGFYFHYLSRWPDFSAVAEDASGKQMGYVIGKAEGRGEDWHGHVTAVTVAPEYRRIGLASKLMDWLEEVSEKQYDGYFVDLFVRKTNTVAIGMYERLGYVIYRRVLGYYGDSEDAYDMRKALRRDPEKKSMVPLDRPVLPEECVF